MDIAVFLTLVVPLISLLLGVVVLVIVGVVASVRALVEKGQAGLIIAGCLVFWAGLGALALTLP